MPQRGARLFQDLITRPARNSVPTYFLLPPPTLPPTGGCASSKLSSHDQFPRSQSCTHLLPAPPSSLPPDRWVCFFQDTNALVFRALLASLGVSARHNYDVNSLAVPRKAKEAIGAIALLQHKDGNAMTINVEYNQVWGLV